MFPQCSSTAARFLEIARAVVETIGAGQARSRQARQFSRRGWFFAAFTRPRSPSPIASFPIFNLPASVCWLPSGGGAMTVPISVNPWSVQHRSSA